MSSSPDLSEACVGDVLMVRTSGGCFGSRLDAFTVARTTKTQIMVEAPRLRRFWKKDGREVGSDHYRGPCASLVTPALFAELENQEARIRMDSVLRKLDKLPLRTRFSTDALNTVTAAVGALVSETVES